MFMVALALTQRMDTEPILCFCVLLPLLLLFSKTQTQTLTLRMDKKKGLLHRRCIQMEPDLI